MDGDRCSLATLYNQSALCFRPYQPCGVTIPQSSHYYSKFLNGHRRPVGRRRAGGRVLPASWMRRSLQCLSRIRGAMHQLRRGSNQFFRASPCLTPHPSKGSCPRLPFFMSRRLFYLTSLTHKEYYLFTVKKRASCPLPLEAHGQTSHFNKLPLEGKWVLKSFFLCEIVSFQRQKNDKAETNGLNVCGGSFLMIHCIPSNQFPAFANL